jgi:Zn ribbon nucleic-acid-binding protein
MAERPISYDDLEHKNRLPKAEWEQDIEHELRLKQCTECGQTANWLRTYRYVEDQVDVFVCRSCGHEMHIHSQEVSDLAEPEASPQT